jgi:hypothetical protein
MNPHADTELTPLLTVKIAARNDCDFCFALFKMLHLGS